MFSRRRFLPRPNYCPDQRMTFAKHDFTSSKTCDMASLSVRLLLSQDPSKEQTISRTNISRREYVKHLHTATEIKMAKSKEKGHNKSETGSVRRRKCQKTEVPGDGSARRRKCQKTEVSEDESVRRRKCQKTEVPGDGSARRRKCQETEVSEDGSVRRRKCQETEVPGDGSGLRQDRIRANRWILLSPPGNPT